MTLLGKTAVVLGGTGVLGSAMARGLAAAGAHVALIGRSPEKTESLAQEIGGSAYSGGDFSRDSLTAVGRQILEARGSIDILLSAIGGNDKEATIAPGGDFFDLSESALKSVVDLNLFAGAITPILAIGPLIKQGSIITVSSVSAELPLTRVGGYAAAKSGLATFTKFAATEIGRQTEGKVRVNSIQPGFFIGEQNRALLIDAATGEPTERGRKILDHTPARRFGNPQDLVGALVFLASDESQFVNGAVIPVDGGFSAFWGV